MDMRDERDNHVHGGSAPVQIPQGCSTTIHDKSFHGLLALPLLRGLLGSAITSGPEGGGGKVEGGGAQAAHSPQRAVLLD